MLTEDKLETCPTCGVRTCFLVFLNDNKTGKKVCVKCKRRIQENKLLN